MRAPYVGLLTAAIVAGAQTAPLLSGTATGRRLFPVITRTASTDAVALTFDDGPDARSLAAFLGTLEGAGATATFFVTGEQVERFPEGPAAIAEAGHEVGVHGYNHHSHIWRAPWELSDDLRRARAIVEEAAGRPTKLFRPPYGYFSFGSWREAGRQGWQRLLWSRWGKDWEDGTSPRRIADTVGWPTAGDIILLHDADRYSAPGSWRNTLGALPEVLERIAAAGLVARAAGPLLAAG